MYGSVSSSSGRSESPGTYHFALFHIIITAISLSAVNYCTVRVIRSPSNVQCSMSDCRAIEPTGDPLHAASLNKEETSRKQESHEPPVIRGSHLPLTYYVAFCYYY